MKKTKKDKLEKAGWKIGTAKEFLELSDEEVAYIELKLAHKIHSSQSRIAKMEAGNPSVSFDLLLKSLLSLGRSPKQLAKVIGSLS